METEIAAAPSETVEETAPVSEEEESGTSAETETEGEGETEESEPAAEEIKRKLTAQERIQQLIEQRNQERIEFERRFAELETKLSQPKTESPEFVEITPQVEAQVNAALAEYDRLRVEAEMEGDYLKALQYKRQFDTILEGLNENQRRAQTAKEKAEQQAAEVKLAQTRAQNAELLRQTLGVPADDWRRAGEWFSEYAQKTPTVRVQFEEIEQRQGTMAAINYAYSLIVQNMGKPAADAAEKREKKPVSITSTAAPTRSELRDDLPIEEWMKRRQKQIIKSRTA